MHLHLKLLLQPHKLQLLLPSHLIRHRCLLHQSLLLGQLLCLLLNQLPALLLASRYTCTRC
jgi:hypothetical protein